LLLLLTSDSIFCAVTSCEEAEAKADQSAKLMTTVKAGVEHLAEKLQHLKAVG